MVAFDQDREEGKERGVDVSCNAPHQKMRRIAQENEDDESREGIGDKTNRRGVHYQLIRLTQQLLVPICS